MFNPGISFPNLIYSLFIFNINVPNASSIRLIRSNLLLFLLFIQFFTSIFESILVPDLLN